MVLPREFRLLFLHIFVVLFIVRSISLQNGTLWTHIACQNEYGMSGETAGI